MVFNKYIGILFFVGLFSTTLFAGNPDRQGEAGAYELLMNPWARSAGVHSINISNTSGVEAMRINVAGIANSQDTEIRFGSSLYLQGTDIRMNALGLSMKVGKRGTLAFTLMALDFGDIDITTENQPSGNGATFSPTFINAGLGYGVKFDNKVSVGMALRLVSETVADVSAFGFAFDLGIQYVAGAQDNFKFGISLRNIGGSMKFDGQGLTREVEAPSTGFPIGFQATGANFEMPSMLNIGISYDFIFNEKSMLTAMTAFTSNSFSRDNYSVGAEYVYDQKFFLRTGFRYTPEQFGVEDEAPVYNGLSAGVGYILPFGKEKSKQISIDYAYRSTRVFNGTHNLSVAVYL